MKEVVIIKRGSDTRKEKERYLKTRIKFKKK